MEKKRGELTSIVLNTHKHKHKRKYFPEAFSTNKNPPREVALPEPPASGMEKEKRTHFQEKKHCAKMHRTDVLPIVGQPHSKDVSREETSVSRVKPSFGYYC